MTCFVLIRHGETDWNVEGRWQGQVDVPLNARGLAQADRLAEELAANLQVDEIYSSDLLRARQTAAPIASAFDLPVWIDARLREIHQGEWQGLQVTEIEARYERLFHRRTQDPWSIAPPGGETAIQVRLRVEAALSENAARHPSGTVVIVSHGFVLAVARTILDTAIDVEDIWKLVPENCTPYYVDWS